MSSDLKDSLKHGRYVNVAPHLRLVAEERDCWKHLESAAALEFPRSNGMDQVSNFHRAIARQLATHACNHDLAADRAAWLEREDAVLAPLASLDAWIAEHAPEDAPFDFPYKLATMGVQLEACYWEDEFILYDHFFGMVLTGDGKTDTHAPRNSLLFKQKPRPARFSLRDLCEGRASTTQHVFRDGAYVPERVSHKDSQGFFFDTVKEVERGAEEALRSAGVSPAEACRIATADAQGDTKVKDDFVDRLAGRKGGKRLARLFESESISRGESRPELNPDGTVKAAAKMTKPITRHAYAKRCHDNGTWLKERVARRHVVQRGVRKNGRPKLRAVDDLTKPGTNDASLAPECPDMPSYLWLLYMACSLCWEVWCLTSTIPRLLCGLDDQSAAYRRVKSSRVPAVMWIMWYSFIKSCAVVQYAFGMLFGARMANVAFARIPRAACVVIGTFHLVPAHHYVDDYLLLDLLFGQHSAHYALRRTLRRWGYDTEDDKREWMDTSNVALGGVTDLSAVASRGIVAAESDPEKNKALLQSLADCRARQECSPSEAESIHGKARWMCGQHDMHVGAAALQPFMQRARGRDSSNAWTEAMEASSEFLAIVFSDEFNPRLELNVLTGARPDPPAKPTPPTPPPLSDWYAPSQPPSPPPPPQPSPPPALGDCIILYTDASEENAKPGSGFPVGTRVIALSFLAFDQRDGRYYSSKHTLVPLSYFVNFVKRETYIGVGELVGAVGAFYTLPELFRSRKVIHFVDNAGALSHMVNGYAGQPDSARLVNAFHVAIMALEMSWYGEWVPSKANPADIMTRPERFEELRQALAGCHVEWHDYELPPLSISSQPLIDWARRMRVAGGRAR